MVLAAYIGTFVVGVLVGVIAGINSQADQQQRQAHVCSDDPCFAAIAESTIAQTERAIQLQRDTFETMKKLAG